MRRVRLTYVLLVAAAVEVVGLMANAVTTFVTDRTGGITALVATPVVALLAGMATVVVDLVAEDRRRAGAAAPPPAGAGPWPGPGPGAGPAGSRRGTPAIAAVVVLLAVIGAGGFAAAAGTRYAVGWVTGNEAGTDVLARPVTARSGALTLTVSSVTYTRHFTRVDLTVRNSGRAPADLPLYRNCTFTGPDGTTLGADSFKSSWPVTVPAGGIRRGVVTFPGRLPARTTTATLAFGTVFGPAGGALSAQVRLRPAAAG